MKDNKIVQYIVFYLCGVLFAVGLGVSGMTNPKKVIGFLDFFGKWDATLMTVLAAAMGVNVILFRFILKMKNPLLTGKFLLPTRTDIDMRLIGGAALFGIGWGLAGYCPGPALTSVASGTMASLSFVMMMAIGQVLSYQMDSLLQRSREKKTEPKANVTLPTHPTLAPESK